MVNVSQQQKLHECECERITDEELEELIEMDGLAEEGLRELEECGFDCEPTR